MATKKQIETIFARLLDHLSALELRAARALDVARSREQKAPNWYSLTVTTGPGMICASGRFIGRDVAEAAAVALLTTDFGDMRNDMNPRIEIRVHQWGQR